jgi:UDP-glucose 4-epimerase
MERRTAAVLADETILVTGASGFIGSALCTRLEAHAARVHGVSRTPMQDERSTVHWWHGDLGEPSEARRIAAEVRPDRIVHLASHVTGAPDVEQVLPTLRSNLLTTVNVLIAANEAGCQRVVLAGSMVEPVLDGPDSAARSPYAVSKWAGSGYARMFHALYGLPIVNLRMFMVYGPGQRDLRKLIPYVILSLLKGNQPRLASGELPVDWIYVDDVVDAFLAALIAPDVDGGTFDVGSGSLVPVRDVVERLVRLVNSDVQPEFGALTDRPLERPRAAILEPTRRYLGWAPTVALDHGLKRTVEWYAEHLRSGTLPEGAASGT